MPDLRPVVQAQDPASPEEVHLRNLRQEVPARPPGEAPEILLPPVPASRIPAALLVPDPDEGEEPLACYVCGGEIQGVWSRTKVGTPYLRAPRRTQRVCGACIDIGWRSRPCVSCGGITRAWNWTSKARRKRLRGWCPRCRRGAGIGS